MRRKANELSPLALEAVEFLTVPELAQRWRTTPAGIHNLKYRGRAPRSYHLGRRTLYRLEDVVAFEEGRVDQPTPAP